MQIDSEMNMDNNLSLNDMISREEYVYSVSNIEDKRQNYLPSEVFTVSWLPGNYCL